jgi:hypothetical protein
VAFGRNHGLLRLLSLPSHSFLLVLTLICIQQIPKDSPYTNVRVFTTEDRSRPNYLFNVKILFSYVQIATSLMAFVSIRTWRPLFHLFFLAFNLLLLFGCLAPANSVAELFPDVSCANPLLCVRCFSYLCVSWFARFINAFNCTQPLPLSNTRVRCCV